VETVIQSGSKTDFRVMARRDGGVARWAIVVGVVIHEYTLMEQSFVRFEGN